MPFATPFGFGAVTVNEAVQLFVHLGIEVDGALPQHDCSRGAAHLPQRFARLAEIDGAGGRLRFQIRGP